MSYNGNYTPLVSVRHQFNSGLWLKNALVVELVDTLVLGTSAAERWLRVRVSPRVQNAEMAELVDAPASKAGVLKGRVGSSPTFGTNGDMV